MAGLYDPHWHGCRDHASRDGEEGSLARVPAGPAAKPPRAARSLLRPPGDAWMENS